MDTLIVLVAKYLYLVSAAVFVGYFLWTRQKKAFFWLAFFALPTSYLLALIAGQLYFDPRPFVGTNLVPLIAHAADNGFPSDHALLTGALAAVVSVFSLRTGLVLWVLAVLVGGARVIAHIHHTTDILGAFLIAGAGTTLVWYVLRRLGWI